MSRGPQRPPLDAPAAHMAAPDGTQKVRHPRYQDDVTMYFQDGYWQRCFKYLHEVRPKPGKKTASQLDRKSTGFKLHEWQKAVDAATLDYSEAIKSHALGLHPGAMTFQQASDKFMAAETAMVGRKGGRKQQRVTFYGGRLSRYINPYIGGLPLPAVDTAACDAMLAKRTTATSHTHSQDVQLVRQVLTYARDVLRVKDAIYLPKRVAAPDARRGVFTPAQFATLTAHISDPFLKCYLQVLGLTGMRAGEGLLLCFKDFGAYAGGDATFVHVPDGKVGRRDFYVLGGGDLASVVSALRAIHPTPNDPTARVFRASEYHHRFKSVLRELDALHPGQGWLVDDEGNDLTVYSLRHMVITQLLLSEDPVYTYRDVARMCGTSAVQLEKHYDHVKPKQMWARLRRQSMKAAA